MRIAAGFWWLVATASISGVIPRPSLAFTSAPASSSALISSVGADEAAASSGVTSVNAMGPLFGDSTGKNVGTLATALTLAPFDRSSCTAARLP